MSTSLPVKQVQDRSTTNGDDPSDSLDVGWLLQRKETNPRGSTTTTLKENDERPPSAKASDTPPSELRVPPTPEASADSPEVRLAKASPETKLDAKANSSNASLAKEVQSAISTSENTQSHKSHKRPHILSRSSHEDQSPLQNGSKPSPRRSSWISSLSSKFSSGTSSPVRPGSSNSPSAPAPDPPEQTKDAGVQFSNPFGGPNTWKKGDAEKKKDDKPLTPIAAPRRPSVLVQAGKERDEHTGFLQSAFRKFSSGNSGLGKGGGSGQPTQRRVMNIDQNRPRVKISDLDASKLRRVAFCVDVEVAGHASWHEVEEYETELREQLKAQTPSEPAPARRQSFSMIDRGQKGKKDKKDRKDKKDVKEVVQKDQAEGAAMKSAQAAQEQIEEKEKEKAPEAIDAITPIEPNVEEVESEPRKSSETQPQPIPGTKKKEKKKRSEAERKERKEKKRRLAERNGQVPLELNLNHDDEDDVCSSPSPPGSLTPNMTLSPTTDPLRIYKRCAQLRETTPVKNICDQISSHSPTLAEAPGTVAILDLTGSILALSELATLADWLAVVPVRKLIMDDCQLTDEGVRMILCGLASCKTADQARRNRKIHKPNCSTHEEESLGVIEKVCLKGNTRITKMGWKHIALFLHISKSLRAIDLSGIPFPDDVMSKVTSKSSGSGSDVSLGSIIFQALSDRFGKDRLEEMILSNCSISPSSIGSIVDAALQCKLRRLGLANNSVNAEGLEHIVRYVESGVCEGLDLGDNDLHNCLKPLSDSLTKENSFFAVSLSGCNLAPSDLKVLLPSLALLPNFRFIDLSHNKGLFSTQPNAVSILRKYLPRLTALKRIHLNDCGMSSEHAIALADILPECPVLAHISILENAPILELMHSKDSTSQEEACALFASLMTATRVSHTLVAVEVEVPSGDSNEVVKALASQVVAYTLRNVEQYTLSNDQGAPSPRSPEKDAPEILLHIVGEMEGYQEKINADEPAPDDDYLMGGNAIVKALGVCLGTAEERKAKTTDSGRGTPMLGPQGQPDRKDHQPRDMSKQLLQSARKIRMRLKPALVHEDRAGNDMNYRRLQFLDSTLQRTIQRFEDEYPELRASTSSKLADTSLPDASLALASSHADDSVLSTSDSTNPLSRMTSADDALDDGPDEEDTPLAIKLSRTPSSTSLASKGMTHQEGRMHRFGQSIRREIALAADDTTQTPPPTQTPGSEPSGPEFDAERLRQVEDKLANMHGDEIARFRDRCSVAGVDRALAELGVTTQELLALQRNDPDGFEKFRLSQVAAKINSGR